MGRLSLFSLIFLYSVIDFEVTAVSIDEFNTLVKNPAWRTLTRHTSANHLTFLGLNLQRKPKIFSLNTIFPTPYPEDNLITERNFHDRVWQFHLLLSVHYAIELQPVAKLAMTYWNFCQDPQISMWKNDCIDSFVEQYQYLYVEIKKMQQSLLYFSRMVTSSTGTNQVLTNRIQDTLSIFVEIVENKQLTEENLTVKFKTAFIEIEQFFADQAYPTYHFVASGNTVDITSFIDLAKDGSDTMYERAVTIKEKLNASIQNLAQSNASYGFIYDPNTLAASVYLPATVNLEETMENLQL